MNGALSEGAAFARLGFDHIVSLAGADHLLFLVALAAPFRLAEWRQLLLVVTAFTIGHSVTLALAVTGAVALPPRLIEFLIPVTIIATAVATMLDPQVPRETRKTRLRALLAGGFGLVHGAGFANYLRSLFVDGIAVPLLGFNIGIELGQVVVLAAVVCALTLLDVVIRGTARPALAPAPSRRRAIAVSAVVALVAMSWAIERRPW